MSSIPAWAWMALGALLVAAVGLGVWLAAGPEAGAAAGIGSGGVAAKVVPRLLGRARRLREEAAALEVEPEGLTMAERFERGEVR